MFHQRLNQLSLVLRLEPQSPLLVKAGEDPARLLAERGGREPADVPFTARYVAAARDIEGRAEQERFDLAQRKQERTLQTGDMRALREKLETDMRFVTTRRGGREEPYLAGSGLKGVLRTRCEQLARTFLPGDEPVCDIFDPNGRDGRLAKEPAAVRYAAACPACRLFGGAGLAGRLSISDAYLATGVEPYGKRSGVGIDRLRGAAEGGALFFYQVLEKAVFQATLTLDNFELWQVGLLAHALRALWTGELSVGYGTHRGLGRLRGEVESATLTYFGRADRAPAAGLRLRGVAGVLAERGELEAAQACYRLAPEPAAVALAGASWEGWGWRQAWRLPGEAQAILWATGAAAWKAFCAAAAQEVM
jgi:CRISPR/Cas system CSM-associated protein Csm3 (group 7 of RAMP superfamily)